VSRTAAVILAGGAARRFGSDKASILLAGRSLLDRVVDVVAPLVDEVVVVGPRGPAGCRVVLEEVRFEGPLSGLARGLAAITAPHAVVLGCDHPLLVPALLSYLLGRRREADAIVPIGPFGAEPLVAVYARSAGEVAARLVHMGERRVIALLDAVTAVCVPEEEWRSFDPDGRSFLDVDYPEDLAAAERIAATPPAEDGTAERSG
jgi:molybdopterin-guanine dinucleotide biosynthesis protein A